MSNGNNQTVTQAGTGNIDIPFSQAVKREENIAKIAIWIIWIIGGIIALIIIGEYVLACIGNRISLVEKIGPFILPIATGLIGLISGLYGAPKIFKD